MKVTIASHFQKFIRNPRSWHSFNAPWFNRCVVICTIFKELLPKKHSIVNAPTPSITLHETCFRSLMNAFSSKLLKDRYSKTFGGNFLAPPFNTQKIALWSLMLDFKTSHWTILRLLSTRIKSIILLDVSLTLVGLKLSRVKGFFFCWIIDIKITKDDCFNFIQRTHCCTSSENLSAKKLGLYLESLDISKQTSDIPMTFERTFRWKFLTTGHLVYLGPYPAGRQSITTFEKRISGDLFYGRGRLPKTKKAAHRRKYFPT